MTRKSSWYSSGSSRQSLILVVYRLFMNWKMTFYVFVQAAIAIWLARTVTFVMRLVDNVHASLMLLVASVTVVFREHLDSVLLDAQVCQQM